MGASISIGVRYALPVLLIVVVSVIVIYASPILILSGAATAVISPIIYCLGSSMAALAYLRLRELKEGAGISEIAEVFE